MKKINLDEIVFEESPPEINAFWDLFQTTNWNEEYKFTKEELSASIQNNWFCLSVYSAGQLIGFGRVISDGVYHALISDLIIQPEFQGQGLGAKVLGLLTEKCSRHKIRDIQLFAAKNKFAFYEKYGYIKRAEKAPGMQYFYKNESF
jgi:ribosomal protein S18 acetylase RimI-like enzyme